MPMMRRKLCLRSKGGNWGDPSDTGPGDSCADPGAVADQSVRLRASIADIDPGAPPWDRVPVKLWQEV